ncbi:MAG: response regulator transcription factor [Chloroflexi bacterium]|nr:response regulator transcription factor [Chloroflexota bacterium]
MLTIAVVSALPAVRAGLAALLAGDGVRVAAQAADLRRLLETGEAAGADVVVVDLDPGPLPDILAELGGAPRPVLLGPASDDDRLSELLGDAAWGYLPRQASGDEIAAAVRAVAAGLLVIHPAVAGRLLGAPTPPTTIVPPPAQDGHPADNAISAREREVLQLIAEGLPNKLIAARLHLSEHTVKFHVQAILNKLGAAGRAEAVRIGARRGLVEL